MIVIGKFKIRTSFNLIGRGLVAIGDILEGNVNVGSCITLNTDSNRITLKIAGVDMGDDRSTGDYFVGLTFVYNNDDEKKHLSVLKLNEQIVEILEEKNG